MFYFYFKKYRLDILAILLLVLEAPLFFYKLGQSSLQNWDEAWYAEIAQNILRSGDLFNLTWNGVPFFDHPPAGFWLMALIFKIFAVNEFWVRFSSAISGLLSLWVVYFLGKELFNRTVGFASAVALSSSFWFVYRARSGNLDLLLTAFFLLSLFLAIKATKNKLYLLPFTVALAFLFLTKTLVPLTIIPVLAIIFWKVSIYRIKDFKIPLLLFIVLVGSWFIVQFFRQPLFLERYFSIGLPGVYFNTLTADNFNLLMEYLHRGVGKWFWPGIIFIILGLFWRQKRFFLLFVFFLTFFLPPLFSSKIQIWHLIPLHPIIILALFGVLDTVLKKMMRPLFMVNTFLLAVCFYFSFMQIKQIWYQFIDIPAYISDEAILSKEAGKYRLPFYIDGDFLPAAVFYSGQKTTQITKYLTLPEVFARPESFVLISYQWRLDEARISSSKYSIIKSDRDKILVFKKPRSVTGVNLW